MAPKVQPSLLRRAVLLSVLLLVLAGALAGCGEEAPQEPASEEQPAPPVSRDFGDPYDIVTSAVEALPAQPPGLSGEAGDTLVVQVGYAGDCADHAFRLDYRAAQDTTFLWLEHDDAGDDCAGYVLRELRLPVPAGALEAPVVVLRNPHGGPPHLLRWGRRGAPPR